jgi:transcriptional regulator with XRE-family HTH domain
MSKVFGDNLRKSRLSEGLSQQELAEKIGTTQGSVSNWELGVNEPNVAFTKKLDAIFSDLKEAASGDNSSDEASAGVPAFAAWLRKARAEAGMSVQELAEASNVSVPAIYNIESGISLNPRARPL